MPNDTRRTQKDGENANANRWHSLPARETLVACLVLTVLRADLHRSNASTYSLGYVSLTSKKECETERKDDNSARAEPCGVGRVGRFMGTGRAKVKALNSEATAQARVTPCPNLSSV